MFRIIKHYSGDYPHNCNISKLEQGGITMGIPRKEMKELRRKVWKLYTDGKFVWEIAKELDIPEAVVITLLNM